MTLSLEENGKLFMLLACQLKIIKVVLQLQHNNLLSII